MGTSSWPNRFAILTMAFGLGAVVVGMAACGTLWTEMRWLFYFTTVATGVGLIVCIFTCPAKSFGKPALGVVPLMLFWLCIGISPTTSDLNIDRNQVLNTAKIIGLANRDYEETFKNLPTDVLDERKDPLLSWRVQILPFIDSGPLYQKFDLKQPWDSKANRPLLENRPSFLSDIHGKTTDQTPWQGFVGLGTAFEPDRRKLNLQRDFPDGLQNTILIVEASQLVPWSKPADIAFGPDIPLPGLGREYKKQTPRPFIGLVSDPGFHAVMADGSVRYLSADISEATLRALIVRNDER
jgi:hypothetical protein